MFCTNCGKENEDIARFCNECGSFLQEKTDESQSEDINITENETIEENQDVVVEEITPVEIISDEDYIAEEIKEDAIAEENIIQGAEFIQPVAEITDDFDNNIEETVIIEPAPIQEVEETEIIESQEEIETIPEDNQEIIVEKPIKKKGFFSYLGLIFSYVIMLVLITAITLSIIAKVTVDGEQFANDIKKIDIIDIEVGEFVTSDDIDVESDDTIQDVIYKSVKEYSDFDITKSEIQKIYEETSFKEFVANKAGEYIDFIIAGEKLDEITAEDIYAIIEENKETIEEIAEINITDAHMELLPVYLELENNTLMDVVTADSLEKQLDDSGITTITAFTQNWIVYTGIAGLLILIILMMLLIFKLNRNPSGSFAYIGSIFVVVGTLLLAAGSTLYLFRGKIIDQFGNVAGIIDSIIPIVRNRFMLFGTIVFGIGLVTIIIKIIVVAISKKVKSKSITA